MKKTRLTRAGLSTILIITAGTACGDANGPNFQRIRISGQSTLQVGDVMDVQIAATRGTVSLNDPAEFMILGKAGEKTIYGVSAGTATVVAVLYNSDYAEVARDSLVVTVVPPPSSNRPAFARIQAGFGSCANTADGGVWCWGAERAYRTYSPRCEAYVIHALPRGCESVPARVPGIPALSQVSVGIYSTCGLTASGEAYCWGNSPGLPGTPGLTGGGISFSSLSVQTGPGGNYPGERERICGVTPSQQIYCWIRGSNPTSPAVISSPVPFKAVSVGGLTIGSTAGNYTACALDAEGDAYCWGYGALGDGNAAHTTEQTTPVAVAGGLQFKEISVGTYHVCALTLDGTAYCWQRNNNGETGTGPGVPGSAPILVPTAVNSSLKFTTISSGWGQTCAVATDRLAYCWGSNHGLTPDTQAPTQVPGTFHFTSISTGFTVTCGLTVEGPEVCWGPNSYGNVGNGYIEGSRSEPTPLAGERVFGS